MDGNDRLRPVARALPGVAAAIALAWVCSALGFDVYGASSDELAYLHAAKLQWQWLLDGCSFLDADLQRAFAFQPRIVVHPTFSRWLAGLGWVLLGRPSGGLEATSLRLFSAVSYALLAALVVRRAGVRYGPLAAVAAVPLFFALTRLMGLAHLALTDVLLCALWFAATLTAARDTAPSRGRALVVGLLVGLALATKLTAVLLVLIVVPFWAFAFRRAAVMPIVVAITMAALTVCALHPQHWAHPLAGLDAVASRFGAREQEVTIATYVFGTRYFHRVPVWVPTFSLLIATSPVVLGLAFLAAVARVRQTTKRDLAATVQALRRPDALLLASAFATIVAASLPTVPAHDMERLFLPLFPFLVMYAAGGLVFVTRQLETHPAFAAAGRQNATRVGLVLLLALPVVETIRIHPNEPSYVSGLIGGEHGAYQRGVDFAFYKNELTTTALREIGERLSPGDNIYSSNLSLELLIHQRQGRFRSDVHVIAAEDMLGDNPAPLQWVLIHARRGFFMVPFDAQLYGKHEPAWSVMFRDVPMLELHHVADLGSAPTP